MSKIQVKPLTKTPANNAVRRLHWLRKRAELERNPNRQFPMTLYI
ncbi:hypothetical protein [Photorhabdus heterorhabditis]|nr:hypothetical protein [Photorhabdus heterorhabditis]